MIVFGIFLNNIKHHNIFYFFLLLFFTNCSNTNKSNLNNQPENKVNDVKHLLEKSIKATNVDYRNAIVYALEANTLAKQTQNSDLIFETESHLGRLYFYKGLYENATTVFTEMLNNAIRFKNKRWEAQAYFHLCGVRLVMEDYSKALDYLIKSRKIFTDHFKGEENIPLQFSVGMNNNFGVIYAGLNKYDLAMNEYEKGIKLCIDSSYYKAIYVQLLNNLGDLHIANDSFNLGYSEYYKALKELEVHPDKMLSSMVFNSIAKANLVQGDNENALKNFREGYTLAKQVNGFSHISHTAKGLSNVFINLNQSDSALYYAKISANYKDSLNLDKTAQKILADELQLSFEKEKSIMHGRLRKYRVIIILVVGLSCIFLFVFFKKKRYQQKQIEKIQAEFQLKEEKVKDKIAENEELKKKIEVSEKELTTISMSILQKDQLIEQLSARLRNQKIHNESELPDDVTNIIDKLQNADKNSILNDFEFYFGNVHIGFFEKLQQDFPDLTRNERRLSAFLKLQLTTKEISSITGQSIRAIEIARTRLRKKLHINNEDVNIYDFLLKY